LASKIISKNQRINELMYLNKRNKWCYNIHALTA